MVRFVASLTVAALALAMGAYGLTIAAPAPEKAPPKAAIAECCCDIQGIYSTQAKTSNGLMPGVVYVRKIGDVYRVQWAVEGMIPANGIGQYVSGVLSVAWRQGDGIGITVFKCDGKALVGRWATLPGNGELTTERIEFLRALPKDEE